LEIGGIAPPDGPFEETGILMELLSRPWPWYVVGPLVGLFVPLLLVLGNRQFGLSSNLRHACAAVLPGRVEFFRYDWREKGLWNLVFALGIVAGGFVGGVLLASPEPIGISERTVADLSALGIREFAGLVPGDLFSWAGLLTFRGFVAVVVGGFLVGFGTAYAGGCTSGHGLSGLADLQPASLVALVGFFVGGIAGTFLLLPLVL
jgi:uncharacterized membrane protein YedE/YeeE